MRGKKITRPCVLAEKGLSWRVDLGLDSESFWRASGELPESILQRSWMRRGQTVVVPSLQLLHVSRWREVLLLDLRHLAHSNSVRLSAGGFVSIVSLVELREVC